MTSLKMSTQKLCVTNVLELFDRMQEMAQKVEGEARQLAEHAAQIRALANRQLRLQPRDPGLGRMSEHG